MNTLLLGFFLGLMATLITTWITARVNKSTDTKTKLLLKIDDFTKESVDISMSVLDKLAEKDCSSIELYKSFSKVANFRNCFGIAEAIGNKNLIDAVKRFQQAIYTYFASMRKFYDARNQSSDFTPDVDEEGQRVLKELGDSAEIVHKLIAIELIRILPSWPERVWLWIKEKM